MRIELGAKVRDPITLLTGIAVARLEHLHGSTKIRMDREGWDGTGRQHERLWFEEDRLEIVGDAKWTDQPKP